MSTPLPAIAAGHICLDILPEMGALPPGSFASQFQPGRLLEVGQATLCTGGALVLVSDEVRRNPLALLAYLRAHPDEAKRLSEHKLELAARFENDRALYIEAKAAMVLEMIDAQELRPAAPAHPNGARPGGVLEGAGHDPAQVGGTGPQCQAKDCQSHRGFRDCRDRHHISPIWIHSGSRSESFRAFSRMSVLPARSMAFSSHWYASFKSPSRQA